MLDTNICIYIAKQKPPEVLEKFKQLKSGEVGMSMITYGELLYGANKSNNSKKAKQLLTTLTGDIPVIEATTQVAEHYADIRATLDKKGTPIGNNDLWIAAHVRSLGKILVSNNLSEFNRVENLKTENWID